MVDSQLMEEPTTVDFNVNNILLNQGYLLSFVQVHIFGFLDTSTNENEENLTKILKQYSSLIQLYEMRLV
jgi:hypothetical protein